MKKLILTVLVVVIISTPCMAGVEPEGLFSIEGTNWQVTLHLMILPFPHFLTGTGNTVGFSGGVVYLMPPIIGSELIATNSFYFDMMVASFFVSTHDTTDKQGQVISSMIGFGLLQPATGIGFMTVVGRYDQLPVVYMELLIKTNDNWTPPGE